MITHETTVYSAFYTGSNEAPPTEEVLREQEGKIMELGERLKGEGRTQEMTDLIQKVRTILKFLSKAKAAKLVSNLKVLISKYNVKY